MESNPNEKQTSSQKGKNKELQQELLKLWTRQRWLYWLSNGNRPGFESQVKHESLFRLRQGKETLLRPVIISLWWNVYGVTCYVKMINEIPEEVGSAYIRLI